MRNGVGIGMLWAALALASAGCGLSGACTGTFGGGQYGECYEDWDQADCDNWDQMQVNGSSWTFHALQTCSALGYTERCGNSWVTSYCPQ